MEEDKQMEQEKVVVERELSSLMEFTLQLEDELNLAIMEARR